VTLSVLESPDLVDQLQPPRFHTSQPRDWTEGPLVAELIAGYDDKGVFVLDVEQRLVVDEAFAYRRPEPSAFVRQPLPRLSAFELVFIAPRQNLKTGALKAIALGKIYISEQRLVVWTSQRATACQEAFRDLRILIESNDDLLAEVVPGGFRTAANNLSIEFVGDRRIIFQTRTADAAQSFTGDTVIIDEAYKVEPEFIASLAPTLAARPEPQIIYASSGGHLRSVVLRSLRERGRLGDRGLVYIEWSATPRKCAEADCDHALDAVGCFLDDEDAWLECNTAVRRGRISLDTLRGLRRTFAADPMKFGREHMCLWEDPGGDDPDSPIDLEAFAGLRDPRSRIRDGRVFALDVAPRRRFACIVAAGESDSGAVHVEIPSRRGEAAYWRGASRVIPTFRRLRKRFAGSTVRILAKSQAEGYASKLVALGYVVDLVQPSEWPAMCAGLAEAIDDGKLAHLGDSTLVDAAKAGVAVDVGEEQWRWGRRKSATDISPLVAMTLAVDAVGNGGSVYDQRGLLLL
jgi:hypothetical protein